MSVKDVQQFLDFTNFYRHFIESYSVKMSTLHNHIKSVLLIRMRNEKDVKQLNVSVKLNKIAQESFEILKKVFIKASLMKHFNEFLSVRVEVNTSIDTVAVILTQQHEFNEDTH